MKKSAFSLLVAIVGLLSGAVLGTPSGSDNSPLKELAGYRQWTPVTTVTPLINVPSGAV